MGAIYVASFENVAVSVAQDLFELLSGSANSCKIRRVRLTSNKLTSEALRITINRYSGSPTSGSGGSTPTIRKQSATSGTATAVVEANNTTRISGGTAERLFADIWNPITPFEWVPLDLMDTAELAASEHFTAGLEAAPGASLNVSGWLSWEEVG